MAPVLVNTAPFDPIATGVDLERIADGLLARVPRLQRSAPEADDEPGVVDLEWLGSPFVHVQLRPRGVELTHALGGDDQLTVLRACVASLAQDGIDLSHDPQAPWVVLRYGIDRWERLLDAVSPATRARLQAQPPRWRDGAPMAAQQVQDLLDASGYERPELFAAVESGWGGIELNHLRFGLEAARRFVGPSRLNDGALPVALAPNSAVFWMDPSGNIYDDTDYEWAIPVAASPVQLFDYWVSGIQGQRWGGACHGYVCSVAGVEPSALRRALGARRRWAWGDGIAVWNDAAARWCAVSKWCAVPKWSDSAFADRITWSARTEQDFTQGLEAMLASSASPTFWIDAPEVRIFGQRDKAGAQRIAKCFDGRRGDPIELGLNPQGQLVVWPARDG